MPRRHCSDPHHGGRRIVQCAAIVTRSGRGATGPPLSIARSDVEPILPLRDWHRREMQCQIVHDSFLRRGFYDAYLVAVDGDEVGYGLIDNKFDPGTVDEFFLLPQARGSSLALFHRLLDVSQATRIRAQTNDRQLLLMLYDCATDITVENVLFADGLTTTLACPGGALERQAGDGEEWQIVVNGQPVAEGGLLFHYNPPYADIFMEVQEAHRGRGYGSYLVQELKRIAYALGKIPAARCNADNPISRRTLERAGMLPCGRILRGDVRR